MADADAGREARPYRTALRVYSIDELARRNRAAGLEHARRYEFAPDAIHRLGDQANANADRRASWTHHPDERVPLALLALDPSDALWSGGAGAEMAETLFGRALSEARSAGHLWTPLLNGLLGQGACVSVRRETMEQLQELGDWVERRRDPRELDVLVDGFPGPWVPATVARRAVAVDPHLADRVARRAPGALGTLVRNPAAGEEVLDRAAEHAGRLARGLADDPLASADTLRALAALLGALRDRDRPAGPAVLGRLVGAVGRIEYPRSVAPHHPLRALARELLVQPGLPDEALVELAPVLARLVPNLKPMASHPSAGPEVWLRALRERNDPLLTRQLAAVEAARRDRAVAELLLGRGGFDTQLALAADAGSPVRADALARAVDLVPKPGKELPNADRTWQEAWCDLLGVEGLTSRHLCELFLKARTHRTTTERIARHPAGDPDLYRFMIRRSRSTHVRVALSKVGAARRDPDTRAALRRTDNPAVLARIAADVEEAGEIQALLEVLAADGDGSHLPPALTALGEAGRVGELSDAFLARLLTHDQAHVRQAVMLVMGEREGQGRGRAGAGTELPGGPGPAV